MNINNRYIALITVSQRNPIQRLNIKLSLVKAMALRVKRACVKNEGKAVDCDPMAIAMHRPQDCRQIIQSIRPCSEKYLPFDS